MFLTATEGEVLFSDTTRLADRAKSAGTDVTLRIVQDSVHVFPIFPFLPETQSTIKAIREWASKRVDVAVKQPLAAA
jgi:salicylate hydroxylase